MKPFMNAKFLISAEKLSQCPDYELPELPLSFVPLSDA